MKASVWLTLVALLSSGAVDCAAQSPASYRGALTVTVENDVATGSDNNYTNGVGVTWVSRRHRHLREGEPRPPLGRILVVPAVRWE